MKDKDDDTDNKAINLTYIVRLLFVDRKDFANISNLDKSKWGFIVNRMMSRKYPVLAQKINVRGGDFAIVMNIWWGYLKDKEKDYYKWFWAKGKQKKQILSKEILDMVYERYPFLSQEDIEYLSIHFPEVFKEEIKYYQKLEKEYGKL